MQVRGDVFRLGSKVLYFFLLHLNPMGVFPFVLFRIYFGCFLSFFFHFYLYLNKEFNSILSFSLPSFLSFYPSRSLPSCLPLFLSLSHFLSFFPICLPAPKFSRCHRGTYEWAVRTFPPPSPLSVFHLRLRSHPLLLPPWHLPSA